MIFRKLDLLVGVPLGLVVYYALSITSAIWTAGLEQGTYVLSLVLTAVISCGLGAIVSIRPGTTLVVAGTMLIIVLIGNVFGSDRYLWVPPLPLDLVSLLSHGARVPVVIGVMTLVGTIGIVRAIAGVRGRLSKESTYADRREPSLSRKQQ